MEPLFSSSNKDDNVSSTLEGRRKAAGETKSDNEGGEEPSASSGAETLAAPPTPGVKKAEY